ncbi:MAG: restriction endonuclease subunit S [Cyanobacteria bacterium P01_F01_bin.143]
MIFLETKSKYCPIKQLCQVIDCEHKTAPYVDSSNYLVVRTSNVRNGVLVLDDIKYTTQEGFLEWTQRAVPEYGDVLFTREAPAGESCLVPKNLNLCIGQRMVLLRANKELINSNFLSFYLTSEKCKREIYKYSIGSTVKRINIEDILKIKIFCPSITEQEKIARFLGAVDARLTKLRRKHELLQTYKRGVMQKIFSQQIRFKQDDSSSFPDWQKKKLEDVASFLKGKGLSKDDLSKSGYLKCIRYAELYTIYDEVIYEVVSSTSLDPDNLVLSLENDVIIPSSGETAIDIAKASCVNVSGVALGGDLNILRTQMNGNFLSYYLNHHKKIEIARIAQGNTVVHLYSSQLKNINIEVPIHKEQEKIVNFLIKINRKIEAISRQIEQTELFKKGLLQKMFV